MVGGEVDMSSFEGAMGEGGSSRGGRGVDVGGAAS